MTSYTTKYRLEHPEWRENERKIQNEINKNKYNTNEEYRRKTIENAKQRYYRLKEHRATAMAQ